MDTTHDEPDLCEQCGLCCKVFGDKITPTVMNLYTWLEAGRTDILRYFSVWMDDGTRYNCTDLQPADLGSICAIELRDPDKGTYLPVCPFLHRIGKTRYKCVIHNIKPDMCGNYMPWIFGETYFPRCKALVCREQASPWQGIGDDTS
ncbi:MAG: YkgJ family cysteine cluster protein [Methanoregulaceae archaeon]|nr:YkgJ family cysteine cluster protein [Methanoregulaceae archaeon]